MVLGHKHPPPPKNPLTCEWVSPNTHTPARGQVRTDADPQRPSGLRRSGPQDRQRPFQLVLTVPNRVQLVQVSGSGFAQWSYGMSDRLWGTSMLQLYDMVAASAKSLAATWTRRHRDLHRRSVSAVISGAE